MPFSSVNSASWYDRNASDYISRTQFVDLHHLYQRFLAYIPDGGRILDAGCGSGRDSLAFQTMGYDVTAMDASIEMVRHTSELLRKQAHLLRHQDVTFREAFDGVWSMASLLHVPQAELPGVLARYRDALVPGGVLFVSFKHGDGERFADERLFTNQRHASFARLIETIPDLALLDASIDLDTRPGRTGDEWFSAICQRTPASFGTDSCQ